MKDTELRREMSRRAANNCKRQKKSQKDRKDIEKRMKDIDDVSDLNKDSVPRLIRRHVFSYH